MSSGQVSETVVQVERDLAKIWAAPDPTTKAESAAKVRASTMNLVVVAHSGELDHLRKSTDDLAHTHAGRVFLVTLDGHIAPWDLGATVHAVCRDEGGTAICSDRIELAFGASSATRASSVVAALTLSEVPLVLEAGAGAPNVLVDELAKRAERLIIDSALLPPARVAELARTTHAPMGDRAWVRTFTWRDLVARFFDDASETVRAITRVEIARTPGGKGDPAAMLIGWLGSRLGWKFGARDATGHATATDATGSAIAIVASDERRGDLGPGEIVSVKISSIWEGKSVDFAVGRTEAARTLKWTISGARSVERTHPLGFRDETWVLIKALDDHSCDSVYRASALAAGEWSAS